MALLEDAALHQYDSSDLKEPEQFHLGEPAKIPVARCFKLKETCPENLASITASKGSSTKYEVNS